MNNPADKELLLLAAKAYLPADLYNNVPYMEGFMSWFNPLNNDADALRLVVKLGLELDRVSCMNKTICWYGRHGCVVVFDNAVDDDPHAATRLAIVCAAAEIGSK